MSNDDVLKAIRNAKIAVKTYRSRTRVKQADVFKRAAELIEGQQIQVEVNDLLKEAININPEGQRCPTCHGTGRV